MKKTFKAYLLIWAILLIVFNVICFVIPSVKTVAEITFNKFGGSFWAGYAFITLAFIGQLLCALQAFKQENLKKLFYNLPVITVSYAGLILTLIIGSLCMLIPNLPNWIGIILCHLVLAFTAIAVLKAAATAQIIEGVDEKVQAKTAFIKSLTVDAESLMNRAGSEEAKAACREVYEAMRYSDPMSNDALSAVEAQISAKMGELASSIAGDETNVKTIADELQILVQERNAKCKAMK